MAVVVSGLYYALRRELDKINVYIYQSRSPEQLRETQIAIRRLPMLFSVSIIKDSVAGLISILVIGISLFLIIRSVTTPIQISETDPYMDIYENVLKLGSELIISIDARKLMDGYEAM